MTLRNHPNVTRFFRAVLTYCNLLEDSKAGESDKETWLEGVLVALAELYFAAHTLPKIKSYELGQVPDGEFDVTEGMLYTNQYSRCLARRVYIGLISIPTNRRTRKVDLCAVI